jgi:hypothetical protein
VTLDSHHINHIAHQSFWEYGEQRGNGPDVDDGDERCDRDLYKREEEESKQEGGYPFDNKMRPKHFSQILSKDVVQGTWVPVDKSLRVSAVPGQLRCDSSQDYCINYTQMLEDKGRFKLTIWPNHCLVSC